MRVTSKDVAKKAGVSRTTVSLVLNSVANSRISDDTRAKVFQVAEELKYQPNQLAQGLKTNRSKTLALIIPSISNPYYSYIAQGIEDIAVENGYTVFICNTYQNPQKEVSYLKELMQRRVDGVILAASLNSIQFLNDFLEHGVAVTVFNREISLPGIDQVAVDDVRGGWLATKHLLDLGHTNIAFVAGRLHSQTRLDRINGYKLALADYGIVLDESLILDQEPDRAVKYQNFDIDNGYYLTRQLFAKGTSVTGLVTNNDLMAIGAIKALREFGLKVPDDISIVGYDDIAMVSAIEPALTTIEQPKYERGRAAAQLIIERLKNKEISEKRNIMFIPSLISRDSCRRVNY